MSLILVGLEDALRRAGCPICRLRQRTERRYLYNLLYESITDGPIRERLAHALGFCPEHAWLLQAVEQEEWRDGLGTGILYEDLLGRIQAPMQGYLAPGAKSEQAPLSHWQRLARWLHKYGRLGRWLALQLDAMTPARRLLALLTPLERCPACVAGEQTETTDIIWLVDNLQDSAFRALYAASDGLCLPHLRAALARTQDDTSARLLVEVSAGRLQQLRTDLSEYVRKFSWQYREEPKHPWQQASWIRAVAFFAGEPGHRANDDLAKDRLSAAEEYHRRSTMKTQQ